VDKPHFATATGLALLGAERIAEAGLGTGFGDGWLARMTGFFREFF
jgi:hypothetical protein